MNITTVLNVNESSNLHPVVNPHESIGEKYNIISHLGVPSGQADLYLCEYENSRFVAKLYKPGIHIDQDLSKKIRNLKSERIAPILETGVYKGRFYEVTPYYSKGDMSRVERIDESMLRGIVIPFINEALHDVHTEGLAHMDLKPSNIFIDGDDSLYLGDFGICSLLADESIRVTSSKGTFGYRPPESYSEISIKSEQFDYYSFGMTILHLWKGTSPYAGFSEMQIMAHTLDGKILIPEDMEEDLKVLILGLTSYDKKKRLGYSEVAKWCKGIDVRNLVDLEVDRKRSSKFSSGYILEGEFVEAIDDLGRVSTSSHKLWSEAVKRYKSGLLDEFVESVGHDETAALMESKKIKNTDAAYAYLLLKANGSNQIYWKNNRFDDIQGLGNAMQSVLPECLDIFNEMHDAGFLDHLNRHNRIEMDYSNGSISAKLLELSYLYSNETLFNYEGECISTFDELVCKMSRKKRAQSYSLLNEMDKLMKDDYFKAWINALKNRGCENVL